jgi:hypothetical protein
MAAALVFLAGAPAFAQGGVAPGAGVQRGLETMSNSGLNGFVTLFNQGARTGVVVDVHSVAPTGVKSVAIQRGKSCGAIAPGIVAKSADTVRGISRGSVPLPIGRLLSGNYVVTVWHGTRIEACGTLYR